MLDGRRCEEDTDLHTDVQSPCRLQELEVGVNPSIIVGSQIPQSLAKLLVSQHSVNDLGALIDLDLHRLDQDRRGAEVLTQRVEDTGMTADLGELPWLLGLNVLQPEGAGKLEPRTGLFASHKSCQLLFRPRKRH